MYKRVGFKTVQEWLEYRQGIITATEASVLLNVNPFKKADELTAEKSKIPEEFFNAYTWTGNFLEPAVIDATNHCITSSFEAEPMEEGEVKVMYVDEDLKLGTTPDARWGSTPLECKSTKKEKWPNWANKVPDYYAVQLFTQMMSLGSKTGYIACLSMDLSPASEVFNPPLYVWKMTHSDELEKIVTDCVKLYWKNPKSYKTPRGTQTNVKKLLEKNLRLVHSQSSSKDTYTQEQIEAMLRLL